jgi:hypothetical protein
MFFWKARVKTQFLREVDICHFFTARLFLKHASRASIFIIISTTYETEKQTSNIKLSIKV